MKHPRSRLLRSGARVLVALAVILSIFGQSMLLHAHTQGPSIAINFGADEPNGENAARLNASDVAGVPAVATANWNNTEGANGTLDYLIEDFAGNSTPSEASVTWAANGTWATTGSRGEENNTFPNPSPDRELMTGYLDTANASTTTVMVSGLGPEFASGCDVYVYAMGGVSGRGGTYKLTDANGTGAQQGTTGGAGFNGPDYIEDAVDAMDQGNYLVFHNVKGSNFTIEATTEIKPFGGTPRAPVNGIEIVAPGISPVALPPRLLNLSPPDGAQHFSASSSLTFSATTIDPNSILSTGISVIANGIDISGDLEVSGTPTNRFVRFDALVRNLLYTVQITVADEAGHSTTETIAFDTFDIARISINFGADEPDGANAGSLMPSAVAGAPEAAAANWNNASGPNGTLNLLVQDNDGSASPTATSVTWAANGTWASTGSRGEENNTFPDPSPDRDLMTGYLDTGSATTTTITVSGLGAEFTPGYDVYVYALGGASGRGGTYTIGTTSKAGTTGDTKVNGPDYVEDVGLDHVDQGNYLVFHYVKGDTFTLTATTTVNPFGGSPRAPVNGIQIVRPWTSPSAPAHISLSFPLAGHTPYTAEIISVFDHSMATPYVPDHMVTAFSGETGTMLDDKEPPAGAANNLFSFKKTDGSPFTLAGADYVGTQATGSRTLNYDGHPGYDYRASNALVYAAADGFVRYPTSFPGVSNAQKFHTLALAHANGYKTYYLHLSTYPPDSVAPSANTFVHRGDLIGYSGSAGVPAAHLHFEVQSNGFPVDPYGWQGLLGSDPVRASKPLFMGLAFSTFNEWISRLLGF